MTKLVSQWLVPGLITVTLGTAVTVFSTSANIASDLTERSTSVLAGEGLSWTDVSFETRDAVIGGTAASELIIAAAIERVAALPGVASVRSEAITAPLAEPYSLVATVENGKVSLRGAIYDENLRDTLIASAGAVDADLQLKSGAPDRAAWQRAVDFGLSQLDQFENAEIRVDGLKLSVSGQAKSPAAFDQLVTTGIPEGIAASIDIDPAVVSPYSWNARFDGERIAVTGYAPNSGFADRLRVASADIPVATAMALASGAPDGFEETAAVVLQGLSKLESGQAVLDGGTLRLTGAPPNILVAQAVTEAVTAAGGVAALDAPPPADYWLTATVGADGKTVALDGYVPDEATRARLAGMLHIDASSLEVATGAPERFDSTLEFGLKALSHLKEGRFSVRTSVLTLRGAATSAADYTAIQTQIANGAPQGSVLAMAEITPPLVTPYVFIAAKSLDGSFHFSGNVPDEDFKAAVAEKAGKVDTDTTSLASGAPDGFETTAAAGLDALKDLEVGRLGFDGKSWSLSGTATTAAVQTEVETALKAATDTADWDVALSAKGSTTATAVTPPADATEPAEPVVETPVPEAGIAVGEPSPATIKPYPFSARRIEGGVIEFSGQVPAEATKAYLGVVAGKVPTAGLTVVADAPEGFIDNAVAGVRALALLKSGDLSFDGAVWSIAGMAATPEDQEKASALIAGLPNGKAWASAVSGPSPIEICRTRVADFSAHTTILFKSGSAVIEPESVAALVSVGKDLGACPDALVHVEGHTDADGPEDANLALSVARSEAVVAALIVDGVDEQRLYAVGYGESTPIASNETRAGKQANRRIVFTILEAE